MLVLLCVLVAGLLRSHGTILRRLHELGAGVGDPSGRAPATATRPFETAPGVPGFANAQQFADQLANLLGVSPFWQGTAIGAIIILALLAERLITWKSRRV